jgi:lipopolysaccharide/colanic/teichoic acid biosynthesis glycosyltransferase/dTDP-4-dehydrorhamnose reductase
MNVLVTGANGFIGLAVLKRLNAMSDVNVVGSIRKSNAVTDKNLKVFVVKDLKTLRTDWTTNLKGIEAIVHTAARVHLINDTDGDPLLAFREVNVEETLNLARQAVVAGVKRFIFISSVKVLGDSSPKGRALTEEDVSNPQDAYSKSKLEAEQSLRQLSAETGLEVVIIRPPLVYGPGVKANFEALMRAVHLGYPLPLGAINNKRSMVSLDNLVDFIIVCLKHKQAANQTFLISDGKDISTSELIRELGSFTNITLCLWSVPVWVLLFAGVLLGKGALVRRLCGTLQVNISKARSLTDWIPSESVAESMKQAMDCCLSNLTTEVTQRYKIKKRIFDLFLSSLALILLSVPMVLLAIAVRFTSKGPVLYFSDRIGKDNVIFKMAKFRSMKFGTQAVATHLLVDPEIHLTPIGSILRKSSLDELPQIWNILIGDMSFIGPRPALFNQKDLITARTDLGVHTLVPGLTGLAQVNGRDELAIPDKVKLDAAYLKYQSIWFDIRILWLTVFKISRGHGVSH